MRGVGCGCFVRQLEESSGDFSVVEVARNLPVGYWILYRHLYRIQIGRVLSSGRKSLYS